MKKIKIEPDKPCRGQFPESFGHVDWRSIAPFVFSTVGILIHRPKHAKTHTRNGKRSHDTIDYWCGGTVSSKSAGYIEDVPEDRILCARCEAAAIAKGEPSADQLTGHHVHIGGVRAFRTCCPEEGSQN